jgi:hypothetical protein
VAAAVPAEHELVEIAAQMGSPEPVIDAERPSV